MKKIKLKFVDFWDEFSETDNIFINILKTKYDIEFSDNPDYIICSVFGENYKSYNCIKIFFTGENLTPNFNAYDYAIGFDYMDFGERYLRMPLYYLYVHDKYKPKEKYINTQNDEELLKRDFCNFVFSNNYSASPIREEFFHLLNKYKKVNAGGSVLNNIGFNVPDKYDFQKKHKFSIAFENSSYPGYTTEKIYDAFLAKTIPIYWGNPLVTKEFNPKSFINVHDYKNLDEVVEKIIELDNNDELYINMLNEPFLINGQYCDGLNDEKILDFFSNIFEKKEKIFYRKDVIPNRNEHGRPLPHKTSKKGERPLVGLIRKLFKK